MVNIQSIIVTNRFGSTTFNSFAEYWARVMNRSTPQQLSQLLAARYLDNLCAREMAEKYGYSQVQTEDVVFLFGSIEKTREQLENVHNRELVFNLENRLVLEMVRTAQCHRHIVTVHRETDIEVIITTISEAPRRPLNQTSRGPEY